MPFFKINSRHIPRRRRGAGPLQAGRLGRRHDAPDGAIYGLGGGGTHHVRGGLIRFKPFYTHTHALTYLVFVQGKIKGKENKCSFLCYKHWK